jgi:hypothetical protein
VNICEPYGPALSTQFTAYSNELKKGQPVLFDMIFTFTAKAMSYNDEYNIRTSIGQSNEVT